MELLKIKCPLKLLYFSGFTVTRLLPLQSACFRNAPKEAKPLNNQTIAKELTLLSSAQARQHFKICLVSLHSLPCSRTEAGCCGATKSTCSCCFSSSFPPFWGGERTIGLKFTQGLQPASPAEGEQLSAYINLSPLAHIGICCSSVLSWLPSGFSEKLAKTQKVSKE